jgi:3',5'-cyclic-AMP phosphodiesterase
MKKLILLSLCFVHLLANAQTQKLESFSFIFMSDIHIVADRGVDGFNKSIDYINKLNPDFVISGGDIVMDANDQTEGGADTLFDLYIQTCKRIKPPLYTAIGNHDIFGLSLKHDITTEHPMYGKKMFEKKIGKRYKSFTHKGWKFFILDDIDISVSKKYKGWVDSVQLAWIRSELSSVDKQMPIAIALHMPLVSVMNQLERGATAPLSDASAVANSKQLLELFKDYNLKLVLQGHQHIYEDIYVKNIRFITGGAISGWRWNGPNKGTSAGFVEVVIKNGVPSSTYIDYGWKPVSK